MILAKRRWYPAFVIYRWRHVLWIVPLLGLLGLLLQHWNRLRWDHVMASYHTRFATLVFSGPESSRVSQLFDIIGSAEVLGKAARDSGLAGAWQMTDAQAAERLRSHVICDTVPGSGHFELKVRKIRGGDTLEICKAIEANLKEQLNAAQSAQIAQGRAERKAVLQKAVADQEAKLEVTRAEFLAETPTPENPTDGAVRFESLLKIQADRRLLEQLKLEMTSEENTIRCFVSPLSEHEAPHWPGRPSTRHVLDFGIAGAWTFGWSILGAIALAYLLEGLIPRKVEKEEAAPEIHPAHECP
jgi:hypothetical protein